MTLLTPKPEKPAPGSDATTASPGLSGVVDRRDFLRLGGAGLAAALLPSAGRGQESALKTPPAAAPSDGRPNILFIWTDQLTRSAMSHAGNVGLRTPAIDSIARQGVVFERAYSNNPICVPSRTSWITAQMSHRTTVTFNTDRHGIAVPPMSRLFKAAGYDTGYVGKWHIPHPATDLEWHGFEYVRHARANRLDPDLPGACDEFLRRKRSKPFFLVASFVDPHDICEWARMESGIKDEFKNGSIPPPPPPDECPPLPANFAIPVGEPEVIRRLAEAAPTTYPTVHWPEGNWRQYLWAYYRLIELVDSRIGLILQTLRDAGLDENTVVIFASDHGDGTAAHHWGQKTLFYEEVVGVPFIVRPPRCARAGARDASSLVSMNLDFFPTVFDYAGIAAPSRLPGRSVRPLVDGSPGASGHDFIIGQDDLAPQDRSGGVYGRMVRTGRHKYIRFSAGRRREQFFDLALDPGEMSDLTDDPAHREELERHRAILDRWMEREGDPFPNPVCAEDVLPAAAVK
jgi:choline-sulfatase